MRGGLTCLATPPPHSLTGVHVLHRVSGNRRSLDSVMDLRALVSVFAASRDELNLNSSKSLNLRLQVEVLRVMPVCHLPLPVALRRVSTTRAVTRTQAGLVQVAGTVVACVNNCTASLSGRLAADTPPARRTPSPPAAEPDSDRESPAGGPAGPGPSESATVRVGSLSGPAPVRRLCPTRSHCQCQ